MGHRGRRRPRRRPLRYLVALAVVGGAVALVPNVDPSQMMNRAVKYGENWRAGEEPAASRFGGRTDLDGLAVDGEAPNGQNSGPKNELGLPVVAGVPRSASGRLTLVPASAAVPVRGKVVRYLVEAEDGLPYNRADFATMIRQVLNDPRSWGRGGTLTFQHVTSGNADFRIALASPALTDKLCLESGNNTDGRVSCFARKRNTVMINALRWMAGAPAYGKNLTGYRTYLINHEVGHRLGERHTTCPGAGQLAPVMVQQTKGVGACRANPWPFPA